MGANFNLMIKERIMYGLKEQSGFGEKHKHGREDNKENRFMVSLCSYKIVDLVSRH